MTGSMNGEAMRSRREFVMLLSDLQADGTGPVELSIGHSERFVSTNTVVIKSAPHAIVQEVVKFVEATAGVSLTADNGGLTVWFHTA